MSKAITIIALSILFSVETMGQVHFNLLPENMQRYMGKVKRDSLEHIIGVPFEEYQVFFYYEVINSYDDVPTGIICFYNEENVLVSLRFPTPHYIGYWIDFTMLRGFPKGGATKKGNLFIKRDCFGQIRWINLSLSKFGCQIYDIKRYGANETAIINYHVK